MTEEIPVDLEVIFIVLSWAVLVVGAIVLFSSEKDLSGDRKRISTGEPRDE